MTEHLFSKYGEFISDKGMRERQTKYFIEHLHQIKSASPIYTNVRGEVVSAEDRDATMSVADFKPETDVEHMSIDNCIGVSGIFLTSQIVGVSGEEAEKICVKIYRYIDEVYDDYSPCMECRFPSFAMAILYGDSLGKFIRYSEPILTSDCKAIKLHQLICLKLKNRLNNLFLDLEIPAEERICGDDGVLGLCRIPGIYCSEAGRYATIFGTHDKTYPIKALCKYLGIDPDISKRQIDDLIRREIENPEYTQGIFLQKQKEKEGDAETEEENSSEEPEVEDIEEFEETDQKGWDEEKAVAMMYKTMDGSPWGRGYYLQNSFLYEEKLRSFLNDHPDVWTDHKMKFKITGIYYSFCRAHRSLRVSICYAIGFNSLFSEPLTNDAFFDAINYAEQGNRYSELYSIGDTGRFFSAERILSELGVSADEIRIGVRAQKRRKSIEKEENDQIREKRIKELYNAGMTSAKEIAVKLGNEGIKKCGARTVQKLLLKYSLR